MLQTAETVRSLGKPSLQTLFLTAIPTKDKYVTYAGVFVAPPDTQFEYDGKIEDVTKGKNNTVAAILSINYDDHDRWLTLRSESKRETLTIYTNYNFKLRTQEFFIENSCDVGKIQKDTHIEYKATVRNCAGSETLSKYFLALIRDKWGNQLELSSRGNKTEVKKSFVELHKYINPHYTSDDNDIYYAFVNYPTMEADDISLELLSFDLVW